MIRRLKRYIIYKFVSYVPGTSKLAVMEAKRLSEHIFINYDEHQQLIMIDEIKSNLIEMRKKQISDKEVEIQNSKFDLERLKNNFNKLQLQ